MSWHSNTILLAPTFPMRGIVDEDCKFGVVSTRPTPANFIREPRPSISMGAALGFRTPGSTLIVWARAAFVRSFRITVLIEEGVLLSINRPIAVCPITRDSHLK
jgi:hypothetical protein